MQQVTVLYFGDVWNAEWRRRQQLAFQLSTMPEVKRLIFVEQPLPLTALAKYGLGLSSPGAAARIAPLLAQRSCVTRVSDRVEVISSIALAPIGRLAMTLGAELRVYCRITSFVIRRVLRRVRPDRLLLWASYPPFLPTPFLASFNQVITWYDCTEDWTCVSELPGPVRIAGGELDGYLTRCADIISVVSRVQWQRKLLERPDAHWIPNAVDLRAFSKASRTAVPDDISQLPRPRLILIGNANVSQDWDLITRVLAQRRQWSLLVVGPESLPKRLKTRLAEVPNLHLLGRKTYRELPGYLAHADVCIQCYRPERAPSFESTTKIFLYLASGKPCVSHTCDPHQGAALPVDTACGEVEFIQCIERALQSDNPTSVAQRRRAAGANTWRSRGKQIRAILRTALRDST